MIDNALKTSLKNVYSRIHMAEQQFNRPISSVSLLAVSKTQPISKIRQAYNLGLRHFGENKLQEALLKIQQCNDLDIQWHFIGSIQSNKTLDIARSFSWVQSLDRLKIAKRLHEQRPQGLPPLNVCIQVNISQEPQKSGVTPSELPSFIQSLETLPKLRLRGLMCIPKPTVDSTKQRHIFHLMHSLFLQCNSLYPLDTLSMGMSQDLEAAIAEGSTMVRIGQAIFGSRP